MKQVSLLALTLASSGVLAIPAPNIFDPIASAISNTLKKWEGSNCDGDCRTGFGWDGRVMGNDPWGMPLNPGQPSGYVAPSSTDSSSSSVIANVAPIPTFTKPTTTAAPILTVASVVPSSSSSSSAAPTSSSTEGVVKIFNAPPAASTAPPQPADGGFSVQDAPQAPPADTQQQQQPAPPDNSQQQQPAPPDNSQQQQPSPPDNSQQQQPAPPQDTPPQAPPAPPAAPAAPNAGDSDIQQYLDAHNTIRRQHGAADLTWSNDLEGFASSWASGCVFEHSGGKFGRVGENLAAGTGQYTIQQAVKDWTDEVTSYNPNNPQPSHFTQVVWKETTQVGCSVVRCPGIFADIANYYVCEYLPAGNIIGRFAAQVQA